MGDRTTVELTVLTVHAERTAMIMNVVLWEESEDWVTDESRGTTTISFYDVDYGELDDLDTLRAEGIAYDSYWGDMCEYSAGCQYGRFTPEGDLVVKIIYDSNYYISVKDLAPLLDDHEALKAAIKKRQEELLVLPFDNQDEYGKLYRTKQLISP